MPIATLYGLDDFFCLGHLVHYDGAFTFYVLFFPFSEKSQIQIATLIYEDWMKLNVKTINTVNIQTWKLKFLENEKENTVIPSMIKFRKSTLIKENKNLFTTITKLSWNEHEKSQFPISIHPITPGFRMLLWLMWENGGNPHLSS